MKRVLLVNPNTEKAPYPVLPLGICLVASAIDTDYDVRVHDGTFAGAEELESLIADFQPDYIGIGIRNIDNVVMANSIHYIEAINRDFVEAIHRASSAPLIVGGAGFSLFPKELLHLFRADFGILGAGDEALPALLRALESGADPSGTPGVLVREGNTFTAPVIEKDTPLTMPFSQMDRFIDVAPYLQKGSYPIQTKRGCTHHCLYCSYPLIEGRRYTLRDPKTVVDEIEGASGRLGDITFEIVDSTLNAPEGHIEAICEEIVARGLSVQLRSMGVNPRGVTRTLLDAMKRAGFLQIDCSADTASPTMLDALRKGYTRDKLEEAATLLREIELPTMWFFMFGGPGETLDTMAESFDFIDRFVDPMDMVHMTEGLRIYPGTGLFDVAREEGLIDEDDKLLDARFYVSRALGPDLLSKTLIEASKKRPNCVRAIDSIPDPEMIKEAMALRQAEGLTEPMFRTFLRIRRKRLEGN